MIAGTFVLCLALKELEDICSTWVTIKRNIYAVRNIKEQTQDPLLTTANPKTEQQTISGPANISLEAISFGYVPVLPPLIQNLNFNAGRGERVALVGGSASGKSTLARLIAGLLQPTEGVVRINGKSLLEWLPQERTRAIAMVQQGMPMLSTTVRNNLNLFNPDICEDEIKEACEKVAIWKRIQELPQGLNTSFGISGEGLSGGEKQRLQLAQALLQKPSILILDEATSALDAHTEAEIEHALKSLHCTQIVIAHRLSTIRDADKIVVLDNGKLSTRKSQHARREYGSHYHNLLLKEESRSKVGINDV